MDAKDLAPAAREAAFSELEASVGLALETYANVHRGTGYNSMASTLLFERARHEILNARGLDRRRYTVIFCTPARAAALAAAVGPERPVVLPSQDVGLPLGLRAVIAGSGSLPKGVPFQTGGGTVRMVSRRSVVWEGAPDRFEAGTPAVVNAVAFARALGLARGFGIRSFGPDPRQAATPSEILHHDELLGYSGRELLRRLQRSTIGRGRPVPTTGGVLPYVHLDNAASMPTFEAVWSAVRKTWRLPEDRRAELVAGVRALCAGFFGAPADRYEVVFTSNATEAINVAARALVGTPSWGQAHDAGCEPVVLNTSAEHNSNELPWRFADGVSLVRVPVDNEGFPDLTAMERLLKEYNEDRVHGRKRVRVVAVSGASNVLGACPDLAEIGRIAHRYGALAFVDAAQLAGHRAIRMAADGLDGLAFSGHKMYAPFGTGGLILRKELWPAADAACRAARESGDENVAGIAALGKAIVLLERVGMAVVEDEESRLTGMTLRALRSVPDVEIYGLSDPDSPRLARRIGVISFGFRHVPHNLAAAELSEEAGIGVRTGCHCAQILVKTLLRIDPAREALASLGSGLVPGITKSLLPGLVRVSFGLENDEGDVRCLVGAVEKIASRRRSLVLRLLAKARHAAPVMPETETCGRMRTAMEREASSVYGPAQAGSAEARSESPIQPKHVPSEGAALWRQPCCRKL